MARSPDVFPPTAQPVEGNVSSKDEGDDDFQELINCHNGLSRFGVNRFG